MQTPPSPTPHPGPDSPVAETSAPSPIAQSQPAAGSHAQSTQNAQDTLSAQRTHRARRMHILSIPATLCLLASVALLLMSVRSPEAQASTGGFLGVICAMIASWAACPAALMDRRIRLRARIVWALIGLVFGPAIVFATIIAINAAGA